MSNVLKILIDRNIEIRAITHETEIVERTINWGPHDLKIDVAKRVPRRPPKETEGFVKEQLPYLPTLCSAAKEGKLEFFSSFELRMEEARQKGRWQVTWELTCFGTYQ